MNAVGAIAHQPGWHIRHDRVRELNRMALVHGRSHGFVADRSSSLQPGSFQRSTGLAEPLRRTESSWRRPVFARVNSSEMQLASDSPEPKAISVAQRAELALCSIAEDTDKFFRSLARCAAQSLGTRHEFVAESLSEMESRSLAYWEGSDFGADSALSRRAVSMVGCSPFQVEQLGQASAAQFDTPTSS
jgi:hypothetical protein